MNASSRLLLLCGALLATPGCATVALNAALRATNPQPAWNGEVLVASDPAGAACQVMRGERVVAEVAATPGTVQLPRSHAVLELRCSAEGHLETTEALRPGDDPAVFRMAPNGIIGATATVISLAGALTMRYPGQVTVTLPPETFASEASRAAWFAAQRDRIIAARATDIAMAEERCHANPEVACDPGLMVMREQEAEDLRRLAALQARAGIAPRLAAAR